MTDDNNTASALRMNSGEKRAAISLAAIYALRMLGLFMVLPVFALHANDYAGATPALIGLAIGVYGLTQAAFQIPFGMLSDRLGRKRVIGAGLLIFAAGSLVAAFAQSIEVVILGRALQGMGAIAAAVLALTADLTREEHRTKAMAIIGVSIGMTFAVAMVLGPALTRLGGMGVLFGLTAVLALGGLGVLFFVVPNPKRSHFHRDTSAIPAQLRVVFADRELLRLDIGILILHLVLTATFTVLPLVMRDYGGLAGDQHWWVYLLVLFCALLLMTPFVMLADRRNKSKEVFVGAIVILAAALLALFMMPTTTSASPVTLIVLLVLFFSAFTLLEATLPALVSRLAPGELKGTALGAYSTSQFFGAFLGGIMGGWVHGRFGPLAVFGCCSVLTVLWLVFASSMRRPSLLSTHLLRVGSLSPEQKIELQDKLLTVRGVAHVVVMADEGIAYLKVNRHDLDREALLAYSVSD
jgi:MFS family permease